MEKQTAENNGKKKGGLYLNEVIRLGNLTKDPEVRVFPGKDGGELVKCTFTIATNIPHPTKDLALFTDVVAWGKLAETCGSYLKKGRSVLVVGQEVPEYYEKDGQKRVRKHIQAEKVRFGPSPKKENGSAPGSAPAEDDGPIDWDQVPF